jgi:hypothetical protein
MAIAQPERKCVYLYSSDRIITCQAASQSGRGCYAQPVVLPEHQRPKPMPPAAPPLTASVTRGPSLRHLAVAAILVIPRLSVAADFASFQEQDSSAVAKALPLTAKQYRQIEPSLYYLIQQHAEALADLSAEQRQDRLVKLAAFIEAKRKAVATAQVIGPGQSLIGLLDPDHGLDPREISALAQAYRCTATIFKKTEPTQTLTEVGDAFLEAVAAAARPGGSPTTVIVLGHGLPEEIQSYHIPVNRLAETLVVAAARDGSNVNLGHLTIICDDCYSADFMINLGRQMTQLCRERSVSLTRMPTLIAGTNRDCVGHADVGLNFVPHFWRNVIELFYIRKPRPAAITLGDFFEKVDNMMYGYGRRPIIQGSKVVSYQLLDPKMVQDPVVFVPLDETDQATLKALLGLGKTADCDPFLDIG